MNSGQQTSQRRQQTPMPSPRVDCKTRNRAAEMGWHQATPSPPMMRGDLALPDDTHGETTKLEQWPKPTGHRATPPMATVGQTIKGQQTTNQGMLAHTDQDHHNYLTKPHNTGPHCTQPLLVVEITPEDSPLNMARTQIGLTTEEVATNNVWSKQQRHIASCEEGPTIGWQATK